MSTAPHLWRKLLEARRAGARLVVVDPFRSRTARVADEHLRPLPGTDAALALGMMRAIARRRPRRRGMVPRPHRRLRRAASSASASTPSSAARRSAASPRTTIARVGARLRRPPSRRCCGWASARSATPARPSPTARSPACRRSSAPGATRGGGCSYIPTATAAAVSHEPARGRRPARRAGRARSTCRQLGDALTDPALDPPVAALVCWNSNPAQIAPDQDAVLEGLRREDLFTVVARAVHDRHRARTPT